MNQAAAFVLFAQSRASDNFPDVRGTDFLLHIPAATPTAPAVLAGERFTYLSSLP